ncbi:MAG: DNA polymerase I [Oscillospiraceae bacterium]|nr:DNA polymerase I [Oscillospiraceae bacterium]
MKLMVLDGNSIVNRAFYGVSQNLTTRDGLPTNAIFGFLNILNKLLDEDKPDALCVTFDRKAPTFRHLTYEGYKAQRKGMPEELAAQMPVLKDVLHAMNIPTYELDGWEADDLIGTIAAKDTAAGWHTTVVTGDKDSLQLITDTTTVKLVSSRMGRTETRDMTPDAFREQYGFDPIHIIDLKALMGDASDNIPGVKGVGEKTAMALIQRYCSIDNLYAAMPNPEMEPGVPAKPGVINKLAEGQEMARLSYDLATIHTDAPIDFDPAANLRKPADNDALYSLFLRLEFSKLIDKYKLTVPGDPAPVSDGVDLTCSCEVVDSDTRAMELLAQYEQADFVACLPLPTMDGLCVYCGGCAAILLASRLPRYNEFLRRFFSPAVTKVAHDIKPILRRLLEEGLSTDGFVFDTCVAAYLLSPTDGSYDLDKLAMHYCNLQLPEGDFLHEEAFSPLTDFTAPAEHWTRHTAFIAHLYPLLKDRLTELGMDKLYCGIELPLCIVLAEMEQIGFFIDRSALADYGTALAQGIEQAQTAIYELAGGEFNINSTQQLGALLFDTLGLPPVKKTKTGYSTNAEVLEKLRGQHPIIEQILDYRQLTKLKSTYADGLGKVIMPDGRIHTSFQNTVTATGRLSSTEPNLQNIPVRTPLGARLREMFVAGPGKVLVDADYSQIELRLLACMANDAAMINGFNSGDDIHTITASQVFGVAQSEVTPDMRRSAKAVNFGIVYGISPFSLSQDIKVTVAQAKDYMDRYFAHYPGVKAYMDAVVEQAKHAGWVATLFGRRRWVPELKSSNFNMRAFGERVALNAPIQGTAADIIKLAMVRVRDRLLSDGLQGRLVLQVHDELIVECPENEAQQVAALLQQEMENVAQLAVPLLADTHCGKSWADAH